MKFISLFSGVGGFDLGLERAGMECVAQCEINPYRREVLARHWPHVERFEDVTRLGRTRTLRGTVREERAWEALNPVAALEVAERGDGQGGRSAASIRHEPDHVEGQPLQSNGVHIAPISKGRPAPVDLICGGFPCQDLSVAGKRAGLAGARSGLFFEFARIVGEVRPEWFLIENVPGLLSSNGGRDFGVILDTLGDIGYACAWRILDSRFFGVPQRRRRVYIVGHSRIECAAAVLFEPESLRRDSEAGRETGEAVAAPLGASTTSASGYRLDLDHETYVADVAYALAAREAKGQSKWEAQTNYVAIYTAQTSANGIGVSEEAHSLDGSPEAVLAIEDVRGKQSGGREVGLGVSDGPMYTLGSHQHGVAMALEAADGHHGRSSPRGDGSDNLIATNEAHPTLSKATGGPANPERQAHAAVTSSAGVRRLTPVECERLQAFPDNYTHGSDGKRYAAMGDAVTVNVITWLGERMMKVHENTR